MGVSPAAGLAGHHLLEADVLLYPGRLDRPHPDDGAARRTGALMHALGPKRSSRAVAETVWKRDWPEVSGDGPVFLTLERRFQSKYSNYQVRTPVSDDCQHSFLYTRPLRADGPETLAQPSSRRGASPGKRRRGADYSGNFRGEPDKFDKNFLLY